MRKKALRDARNSIIRRINELHNMTDEALLAEVKRAWPQVVSGTREEQILFLIKDYVDRSFPEHVLS